MIFRVDFSIAFRRRRNGIQHILFFFSAASFGSFISFSPVTEESPAMGSRLPPATDSLLLLLQLSSSFLLPHFFGELIKTKTDSLSIVKYQLDPLPLLSRFTSSGLVWPKIWLTCSSSCFSVSLLLPLSNLSVNKRLSLCISHTGKSL